MKNIFKTLSLVGAAVAALSSCDTLTAAGLNPMEQTIAVPVTVVAAGQVTYDEGVNMNQKSKKWAAVQQSTAGYKQQLQLQTADGSVIDYNYSLGSGSALSAGATGTANVGVKSGKVWSFSAN